MRKQHKRPRQATEERETATPRRGATLSRMECATPNDERHHVEQDVRRQLLAHPELRFSSLVIRRIRDGVCLEGVLEVDNDCPDVCRLAKAVDGVEQVLNHLVVRRPAAKN